MISNEPPFRWGRLTARRSPTKSFHWRRSPWREDPRRQRDYDVHAQTQSIILLFCEGWPNVTVTHGNGWDLLAEEATPVMEGILSKHYPTGGTILRAMGPGSVPGAGLHDIRILIPRSRLPTVSTCPW